MTIGSCVLFVTIMSISGIKTAAEPPTSWPHGKFSLMMADGSCPDFAHFEVGERYQNTEDNQNENAWTIGVRGFSGVMSKSGFNLIFCTKTDAGNTDMKWPKGNYCIHQYGGSCPDGFSSGSIKFDDEDDGNDKNSKDGILPGGVYDYNTKYYFCCRKDGDLSAPIDLPVTKAFYLYPFTDNSCQVVRGMNVTKEFIHFDTQDTNNVDKAVGSHPYIQGYYGDYTLNLCYYKSATDMSIIWSEVLG